MWGRVACFLGVHRWSERRPIDPADPPKRIRSCSGGPRQVITGTRILAAGCAAALAVALGVPAALAGGTWTVRPGGHIQAASGRFTIADIRTGTVLGCTSSTASGTLKTGTGLPGSRAGSLSAVGISGCEGPGGLPRSPQPSGLPRRLVFRVQATGLPWHVNFSSYDAAKDVVRGTISHLQITGSGAGCTFVVDGTSGTAKDGRVMFSYNNGTGRLKILTAGANLHWYGVSNGCLGLVNSGDPATLSVPYTLSPKQAITSP